MESRMTEESLFSSTGAESGLFNVANIADSTDRNYIGEWSKNSVSGSDQDLHRSQQFVTLSELTLEDKLLETGTDALVETNSFFDSLQPDLSTRSLKRSLVIIDQSVKNWRELVTGVPLEAEVLVLDHNQDGVSQITNYLADRRLQSLPPLHSAAIVSEGSDGKLLIGNGTLENSNLERYREEIAGWRDHLLSGADLLLFGCNVAASTNGIAFIQKLAEFTKADVAASNDLTGTEDLGGDTILEIKTGNIETEIEWLDRGINSLGQVLDAEALGEDAETDENLIEGDESTIQHEDSYSNQSSPTDPIKLTIDETE